MSTAVKRACDACHRRKVKCDGVNPCRNCSASQLTCTYNAIPQKKGPKGSRAKVISELRETQRQTHLSAKVQTRLNGMNSPPSNSSLAPSPGLLTPETIKECIEFYFANMYPMMPILHRQRLEQQTHFLEHTMDTYCLLTSLSAFMMLQPGMNMPGSDPYSLDSMPGANIVSATVLLEETLRVRKSYDYLESSTPNTLCTSYFLFGCYYGLDMHDKAWFHLREATTLMHMLGMNHEETYSQYDRIEASRRRRLYWLFFVTERAYALQRRRPLTLQPTINLPTPADDPSDPLAHQLSGFVALANLFRPFDDAFVALWARAKGECSQPFISGQQKHLQEALPPYLNSPDAQFAELQSNQQWLKNVQWQLSMANGNAAEMYSTDVGRELLTMVSHFPGNLGLLGLGLIDKLSDISCGLTEYLSMQPASRDPFSIGPREQLHQVLNVLSVLRNGDHQVLPLLLNKVHDILPRLANPMLQNAPENACNIDIFDGFGNAGMAQPPMFPHEEYDNKFAIPRIDELSNDSGSSAGGPSSKNDMNSPFVSSPPIMSPGVEMGHGMHADFNSMPDMVMSSMGASTGLLSTSGSLGNQQPQHQHQQHQQQHQQQQHQQQQQLQQQQQQYHQLPHQQQQHHQPQHQHHPMSGFQNLNPQLNMSGAPSMTLNTQSLNPGPSLGEPLSAGMDNPMNNRLNSPMGQTMNGNNMMARQQPQRANSFAIPSHTSQIRTIGDFHALQRANTSDLSPMTPLGISNMGPEMDFNALPR